MGFEEARKKSLSEIINTESNRDDWATTCFMKLVDAKIGQELNSELRKVAASLSTLTERIPTVVQELIRSNESLSKSNERYSKSLCWLTAGLVFVGVVQVIAQFVLFFLEKK